MSSRKRCAAVLLAVLAVVATATEAGAKPKDKDRSEVAQATEARPAPGAPTLELLPDDGSDRESGDFAVQAAYLPFNFSFDFTSALVSRTFWPSTAGRACVSLRGTGSTDPTYYSREIKVEMWNAYGTDTRIGLPVRYRLNGSYYGYCWTGLYPYHEHYFRLTKDWNLGARVWGNGFASPS